jgi:hypothetical protein
MTADRRRRPGWVARRFGGKGWLNLNPFVTLPVGEIARNAQLIRGLAGSLGRSPVRGRPVHVLPDRRIDLEATAFTHGMSVATLEALIERQQRRSTRAAYLSLTLGCAFSLLWLWRALTGFPTAGYWITMIEFLPFCAVFYLLAFRSALESFQLRTRTLATAWEYLSCSGEFWPR